MSTKLFSVLPMTQRFSIEPGHTYKGSITVAVPNDATEDFNYKVSVTPFSVVGEDYGADLKSTNGRTEIAKWITIENPSGTVSPNGATKVNFTITVPENAGPGGQYATLLVTSDSDAAASEGGTINNLFQLASIIYADVSGEIIRDGSVLTNEITGFTMEPKITTSTTVENKGNTHQDATIVIKITNSITGETIFPSDNTSNGYFSEIIMPDTTRYITEEIGNMPLVGVVKVSQTVYFNDVPYALEKDVFICPLWFMALVALTIVAVISAIVFRVRSRKRKKSLDF